MLRFNFLGFPVRIEWMFWIIVILLGMNGLQTPGTQGIINLLVWAAVLFTAVLLHELGHALARKRYRAPYSEIVLTGFGGYCAGPGSFTRNESMAISFAGPLVNLVLAGIFYAVLKAPIEPHPVLRQFITLSLYTNSALFILNLLPVLPLDGGRILEAFLANRSNAGKIVPMVGLIVAIIVAVYGISIGLLFLAVLFGYLAFLNFQRLQGGPTPGLPR
ncbi:MAG: site-2 protease family protein [Verrucomicrobiota bacterium]